MAYGCTNILSVLPTLGSAEISVFDRALTQNKGKER